MKFAGTELRAGRYKVTIHLDKTQSMYTDLAFEVELIPYTCSVRVRDASFWSRWFPKEFEGWLKRKIKKHLSTTYEQIKIHGNGDVFGATQWSVFWSHIGSVDIRPYLEVVRTATIPRLITP